MIRTQSGHLGPDTLGLRLPPDLEAVEPGLLRQRAAEHQAEATATRDQAAALRSAVAALVPAAWLGLGSLSFASRALFQAGCLETVGHAVAELAEHLTRLADALDAARQEAASVIRSAAALDDEVALDNAMWARRPFPERADPDPVRVDAQFARARLLVAQLAAVTEAARSAWARAAAGFDLVAYRMPHLSARMSGSADDGWQLSRNLSALPVDQWRQLVGPAPVCIGAGWTGSGLVVGPDGRRYPVVRPWVEDRAGRWSADLTTTERSVSTLGGLDPGWNEIGVRVGLDTFGAPAGTVTKAAIVTAGLVGNAPRMIGRLRPDLLPHLRWTPAGVPSLPAAPTIPAPRTSGTGQIPRAGVAREGDRVVWTADTSRAQAGRAGARANADLSPGKVTPGAPNLVGLVDSGLTGAGTARRLDDSRTVAYRVTFEENDDGRTRARVTTYQVRDGNRGRSVLAHDLSVAPDGTLRREPVTYRPPAVPEVSAAN